MKKPNQEPALKIIAMPAHTNPNGDIFGGWLLSMMDLAGATVAKEKCKGRVVTVSVDQMEFKEPVFVGDDVSSYATIEKVGNSSMRVKIDVWAKRMNEDKGDYEEIHVTTGTFTYVAIDLNRKPRPVTPKP